MALNLASTKAVSQREDAGTDVHLKDETGTKMYAGGDKARPVTVRVVGTYSTTYRDLLDDQRDRLVKRRSVDGEEMTQQNLELVAGCILGWENMVIGDETIPFTRANAIELLAAAPWIKEQIDTAMSDHQRFFKPASTP